MSVVRGTLLTIGALTMAYAVAGALTAADTHPAGVLIFLVAVLIVHDAVWMPAVLAVVALLAGLRRRRATRGGRP
jgi:MYXO-CTERM domain-containing protein